MTDFNNNVDRALDWDDDIEKESEFILLPEGEYNFVVTKFERGRHAGSVSLPPCNKAIIFCCIESDKGKTTIKNNLFLHTKTESFLSAFFISIGQKKKGMPLKMNWNQVVGARGRCKVGQYVGSDGNTYNEIKNFLEPIIEQQYTPGQF